MDHLLVDGYNVIHGWEELRSSANLEHSRHRLIDDLSNYQGFTGIQVTVVFDSSDSAFSPPHRDRGVTVLYASHPATADQVIEAMCQKLISQGAQVGVVTSDRLEANLTFGMGCSHWTVVEFAEELSRMRREMKRWARRGSPRSGRAPLGSAPGVGRRLTVPSKADDDG
jgi:predicted RNA-binding protein with PIN domain